MQLSFLALLNELRVTSDTHDMENISLIFHRSAENCFFWDFTQILKKVLGMFLVKTHKKRNNLEKNSATFKRVRLRLS